MFQDYTSNSALGNPVKFKIGMNGRNLLALVYSFGCLCYLSPGEEMTDYAKHIADSLGLRPNHVAAVIEMLDGGNTVPFIARYRKEIG
jgi:hypothetical protein